MDWIHLEAPSLDDLENLARAAYAALPADFRALTGGILFRLQEFPDEDVLDELEVESEFDLLGLFQGPDLAASDSGEAVQPTAIYLYRRPILDYWTEHREPLGAILRHVLVHEIGHHFGLGDAAMEAIEAGA